MVLIFSIVKNRSPSRLPAVSCNTSPHYQGTAGSPDCSRQWTGGLCPLSCGTHRRGCNTPMRYPVIFTPSAGIVNACAL
ncbi:MAG: hypothetical protein LBM08_05640 [Dysgonamonadaceae bacterium]|nr:hypothetical protein [Dysgonamonadaceae bacterium]